MARRKDDSPELARMIESVREGLERYDHVLYSHADFLDRIELEIRVAFPARAPRVSDADDVSSVEG